jgi:hypothetical protein
MAIAIPLITTYDGKGVKRAMQEFKQLETVGQKAQFALKKAAIPAALALGALGAGAKSALLAGEAVNSANARIGQINKSMNLFGSQTDKVTKRLVKLAEAQGRELGVSNLTIKATQAKLLTFKNLAKSADVVGGAFDRANQAALDMAAAGFGESTQNAVQLGKALEDPIKGITALARSGVTFTTQEKEKIKTLVQSNRTLEAQELILAAIEKQVGGTAKATADDTKKMAESFAQVRQSLGTTLLPILEKVTPKLQEIAGWAADNPKPIRNVAAAVAVLASATLALNAAMAVNPYVAAAAGIVAMGAAFDKLYREIDKVNKVGGVGARVLGVIFGGPAGAMSGMNKVREGVWSLFGVTGKATANMQGLNKAQIENAEINGMVASGLIPLTNAENDFTEATSKGSKALNDRLTRIKQLRKEIGGNFSNAIDRAKNVLGDAQKAFGDFAKSVSDSITGAFSFKAAKEAATETGQTFLEALTDQVTKTQDFTVKINRLLAAGLSESALQQVLAAGQEAGGAIADELLAGGADAIGQANALTAKVQSLGASVGQNAATQFYQGGVDAGNALVQGISAVVSKYRIKLSSKGLSEKQLKRLQRNLGIDVDFLMSGGIPALADGGIVTGPQLALIGEAGPEAVIPLDRMGSMGGGDVNIYVQGADPNAVVDALRTYMFRNGSVPIRVS